MTPVFADASYYIALLSSRDQQHQTAVRISADLRRPITVTEFVLIEVCNILSTVESRARAVALWQHARNDPFVSIVPASAELVAKGFELHTGRPGKTWSPTDCISFVVMETHGLTDALTADYHFQQAGFTSLLLT